MGKALCEWNCLECPIDWCKAGLTPKQRADRMWRERAYADPAKREDKYAKNRAWLAANKEKMAAYMKAYHAEHREEFRERNRKWLEEHREEHNARLRAAYAAKRKGPPKVKLTPEERTERRREYSMHYYEANKEEIAKRKKAWYEANKERILARQKEYKIREKDRINARRRAQTAALREQEARDAQGD